MNSNYSSVLPYPPVGCARRDIRLARRVSQLRSAELSAVSEYLYQSIIFEELPPRLSALLEDIAITEARHFRLLSELMAALGANPAINDRIRTSVITTEPDAPSRLPRAAKRAVAADLASERHAAQEYRQTAEATDDLAAAALLLRIAADEEHHARLLEAACREMEL